MKPGPIIRTDLVAAKQTIAAQRCKPRCSAALLRPVAHVVEHMAPGGIETLALDLVRGSDGAARVISLAGKTAELAEAWPALAQISRIVEGMDGGGGPRPVLVRRLAKRLRALRARAVVLHHIGPLLYGGLAARLAGVPAIIHVEHDVWHYDAHPRHRFLTRLTERLVRPHHVALSDSAAATLREIIPRARIEVIPTGIDLSRFTPQGREPARTALGLKPGDLAIGTVGRLVPVKGHAHLLDAFARLDSGDARLFIVGDGPEAKALRAQADALGMGLRAVFLGHRDDVAELLPGLDLFVLPSLAEGLPRTLLEAQACGVPAVATRVGSVVDAVCSESGILVPPADPDALAGALADALACGWRVSPRDFVKRRYDWQRTLAAYERITGGVRAG